MTEFSLSYCRKGSSGSFRSREVGRGFLLLANAVAKDLPRDLLPDQNTAKFLNKPQRSPLRSGSWG